MKVKAIYFHDDWQEWNDGWLWETGSFFIFYFLKKKSLSPFSLLLARRLDFNEESSENKRDLQNILIRLTKEMRGGEKSMSSLSLLCRKSSLKKYERGRSYRYIPSSSQTARRYSYKSQRQKKRSSGMKKSFNSIKVNFSITFFSLPLLFFSFLLSLIVLLPSYLPTT